MTDKIAELKARREQIDAEIQAEKQRGLDAFVERIIAMIAETEFSLTSVIARLRESRNPATPPRKQTLYRLKADPSKVYVKGPTPSWMKTAIAEAGMDAKDPASREMFKALHMTAERPSDAAAA